MFTLRVNGESTLVQCNYEQMVKFFPEALKLIKIAEEGNILPKESPDTEFVRLDLKNRKPSSSPPKPKPVPFCSRPTTPWRPPQHPTYRHLLPRRLLCSNTNLTTHNNPCTPTTTITRERSK